MTDELTLRERVLDTLYKDVMAYEGADWGEQSLAIIAALLEDTGSPAHMRVAAELRGE